MAPDAPWIFRTYAGHSTAAASNALFRRNLESGQTGLSIAFDLPTQCGYDSDHPLALPEVGKVGVPVRSLDDMHVLFDGLPLAQMNTSMTINATAPWLLAMYVALAMERGEPLGKLRGTTQNDIIKEYIARGTYIFPPAPSLRLTSEMFEYCVREVPLWNPANICSYHLQEAGATVAQEVAFALADAMGVLDEIVRRGRLAADDVAACVGRLSFFVNAGTRFIEEACKLRAFTTLWDELCITRYGITDAAQRVFRYGVQVNSLGLTEAQPENNAWRIAFAALGVTLSKRARCRALQLPAWNEAMSLPRPWDQQWSLRLQQVLAYETDLLEYEDVFDGNPVIAAKTTAIMDAARAELAVIEQQGGVVAAVESGYLKRRLVESLATRALRIETGQQVVVGVNRWQAGLPSPLVADAEAGQFVPPTDACNVAMASLAETRRRRDGARVARARAALAAAAKAGEPIMGPSIECALARVTTGEWADTLREVFGEYRPRTGLETAVVSAGDATGWAAAREALTAYVVRTGHRPRLLVGKPGLDGHSNGAEMIAVAARDVGFEVVYGGLRSAPSALAQTAIQESVDVIGLSILSGSHVALVEELLGELSRRGGAGVPIVVGGVIPPADRERLLALGVRRVFTSSDYAISAIMHEMVTLLNA